MDNPSGETFKYWLRTDFLPHTVTEMANMLDISRNALYTNWLKKDLSSTQIARIFTALKEAEIPPGAILSLARHLSNHPKHADHPDILQVTSRIKNGDTNVSGDGNISLEDSPTSGDGNRFQAVQKFYDGQLETIQDSQNQLDRALRIIEKQQEDQRKLIDALIESNIKQC